MQPNYVNFLAGNQLNRLSWKRSDAKLIQHLCVTNSTWIIFKQAQPLVTKTTDGRTKGLAYLPFASVKPCLGHAPYFGQHEQPGVGAPDDEPALECARIRDQRIVFLGVLLDEGLKGRPDEIQSMIESNTLSSQKSYFAFDLGDTKDAENILEQWRQADTDTSMEFSEPRSATMSFSPFDAGIFSEARSIVDWNTRNKFCPACGSPNYSLWAGWKLACTSLLPWRAGQSDNPCPSGKGLQNYAYPRTDPVIIVAVVNPAGDKILLGRNKKFPPSFYSCLAGFLEPGESIEEAVRREVFEEAGVGIGSVHYHSAQPWPYPANLMLGFFAVAKDEAIHKLDDELADVKFFSKSDVRKILAHPQGAVLRKAEYKKFDEEASGVKPLAPGDDVQPNMDDTKDAPIFRVPPVSAIAGVLISEWAFDRVEVKASL